MKNQKNNLIAWVLTLCGGAAACVLRVRMMQTGLDEKGLLIPGNPNTIALWVLSIAYLVILFFLVRRLNRAGYAERFPACRIRGSLCALGGLVLLFESGVIIPAQLLIGVLGAAAGFSMVLVGVCRWNGKRPNPLFHILVCVFFIIRLIFSFRGWSADPQLQDYGLQLMASVCLMLFAFHRAGCDAGVINEKRTAFFGLAAVYFCIASLSDEAMPLLYAASALWAAGAGCNLDAPEQAQ